MSWADGVGDSCDSMIDCLHKITNESTILALRFLHRYTPVDTTNAQNSWYLSPNAPTYVQFGGRAVGRDPVAEARAVLANSRATVIHVTNSEDYIEALEWGTSAQARNGFMQQTTDAWPSFVAQAASMFKAKGWR
ncbi:MAG: hypothetical protein Q7J45_00705 [bacterium]|nr:hypothetical protein [bacterium]